MAFLCLQRVLHGTGGGEMRYEIGQVLKKDQVMKLVFGKCSVPKQILGRHLEIGRAHV